MFILSLSILLFLSFPVLSPQINVAVDPTYFKGIIFNINCANKKVLSV